MSIDNIILERAKKWLGSDFDQQTRDTVEAMIKNDPKELVDSFYCDLEFGTGGLRGIMGVGTNRMNKYTVGMATQGLANYIKKSFGETKPLKVAIAYDSRHNSNYFANMAAEVLSANGIQVYVFGELTPTPLLSFAVRHYRCNAGIVITASHNPKEYNGYKVYWNDGGQLVEPHDTNVITEVQNIKAINEVKFMKNESLISTIGDELEREYINKIRTLSLSPESIAKHKNCKIVFTPLHGTCVNIVPKSLKAFGFENIVNIPEQDITSGDFPTIHSPNPEESAALEMAIKKARQIDADLVMATDPDGDRVGIAVKDDNNEFVLLNGNQAACLLVFYLLTQWKQKGKLTGEEYIVKTIVTTELLKTMAADFNVECFDVLTGFKYIGEIIGKLEGKRQFIGGGEESYGYLIGDFTRDKDAVISCCFLAEVLAWAKDNGFTMYQLLTDIYGKYGFYKEKLVSITKKGKEGMEEIQAMMERYRNTPPQYIDGSRLVTIKDFKSSIEKNLLSGKSTEINLPKSNVLQFFLENGSKITMRPSGTEPKIKFYFGVMDKFENKSDFEELNKILDQKLEALANGL